MENLAAQNKDIVRRATRALSKGNFSGFLDHCSDDIVMRWPGTPTVCTGKDAIHKMFTGSPLDTSQKSAAEPAESPVSGKDNFIAEGDTVAGYGTMKGMGQDGKPFDCAFGDFYTVKDGKITEVVSHVVFAQN